MAAKRRKGRKKRRVLKNYQTKHHPSDYAALLNITPENWAPALGDANHGFPYLSGRGRLVIKDVITLGAGLVVMADSAKACRSRSANLS